VAQAIAKDFFLSLKEFPPRQVPASFNPDAILRKIEAGNN